MTVVLALLAQAAAPLPASPHPHSAVVEVGELDLATGKGQHLLALRIQRAARAVCEAEALSRLPQTIRHERRCIRQAVASVQHRLSYPGRR
jgi:UrcA family protein